MSPLWPRSYPACVVALLPANYTFSKELPAAAIAAFRALDAEQKWQNFAPILEAVDYPNTGGEHDRIGPRAETLTPAQRAAVELITELDLHTNDNRTDVWMPRWRADRRSWLGLDVPQPLDKLYTFTLEGKERTEPAWRALKLLDAAERESDDDTLIKQWLATVPLAERLAMWGQANLHWPASWRLSDRVFFDVYDQSLLDRLGDHGKDWAPAYADATLASMAAGTRSRMGMSPLPLLALVRAKIPIEPRWDVLVPLNRCALEILQALPVERRGPGLAHAMKHAEHPSHALRAAKELLSHVPYPEVAAIAIQNIADSSGSPNQHLTQLKQAAEGHPRVLAVILVAQGKRPPEIKLKTLALRSRSSAEETFSEIEQSQLRACGRNYFGKELPLSQLLSVDNHCEESLRHVLSYRAVGDAQGKHVYDMWEYMGDSGSIFEVGTTNEVAAIVQGSVECEDEALRDALEKVMRQGAPKPSGGKKAPAKKASAKEPGATKKPAAKLAKKTASAPKPSGGKSAKKAPVKKAPTKKAPG